MAWVAGGGVVARAAVLLAALTALSQVLGFVRDAVIAAVYGAGAALDAYLVAQGLMNLVLALVAGAMSRALVPSVSRAVESGNQDGANRIVSTMLTATLVVLLTGGIVMYVAAEVVVTVLAPGFDAATRELAVELARIILVASVFVAGTDILAAAAQAHGKFFASGVQGVPFNLVMIAAAWIGAEHGAEALAVGFVVGSAVRMLIQLVPLPRLGIRLRPRLDLRDPAVAEALRLVPALLITTAAINVNTLVDRAVGSAQGEGVVAALNFGWRIVTLVDSLLVVTLVTALYPALGAAGTERRERLRVLVTRAMRTVLTLLVPVVGFLVLMAEPLVRVLFGRGEFGDSAVSLTAVAVTGYAVSAVAIAVRSIGTRTCLAVGDVRTPVLIAAIVMVTNVIGDLTLGFAYGVAGLSASTSLSLVVGALAVVSRLHRRHRGVRVRPVVSTTARTLLATAAAVAACLALGLPALADQPDLGGQLVGMAGTAALGLLVYATVMAALRGGELKELRTSLQRRPHDAPRDGFGDPGPR